MAVPSAMAPARFWEIIAKTISTEEGHDQEQALREELSKLELDEVFAFDLAFIGAVNAAYSWDLWGAAYVMNGGCSDDGFEYFRRWLIAQGQTVYEAALADPESLADRDLRPGPFDDFEFESFGYVAAEVSEEKGGKGDFGGAPYPDQSPEPKGVPFHEDEEALAARFPKLSQRYTQG